jgi:hypothetical protein
MVWCSYKEALCIGRSVPAVDRHVLISRSVRAAVGTAPSGDRGGCMGSTDRVIAVRARRGG